MLSIVLRHRPVTLCAAMALLLSACGGGGGGGGGTAAVPLPPVVVPVVPPYSGLYLSFPKTSIDGGGGAYGAVPATNGAVLGVPQAPEGGIADYLLKASIAGGVVSSAQASSLLYWGADGLYRQDLNGVAGALPASVRVSSIPAGVCRYDRTSNNDSVTTTIGSDYADPSVSWKIYGTPGADFQCGTFDDAYLAVRMNMAPGAVPLSIGRPLSSIRNASGALTGWLLQDGLKIVRANADFSNPVTWFNLGDPHIQTFEQEENIVSNVFVYRGWDSMVYAVDLTAASPTPPAVLGKLGAFENIGGVLRPDSGSVVVVIFGGSGGTSRLVRYATATKTVSNPATFPEQYGNFYATPTQVVMALPNGSLLSAPLGGGASKALHAPAPSAFQSLMSGGERVWSQLNAALVSINTDGSGLKTMPGASLAGCARKPGNAASPLALPCDSMMVIEDNVLRGYDAISGALRTTYGPVTAPPAGVKVLYRFSPFTFSAQGGVLTQVVYSANGATHVTTNYYVEADKAGLALVSSQ